MTVSEIILGSIALLFLILLVLAVREIARLQKIAADKSFEAYMYGQLVDELGKVLGQHKADIGLLEIAENHPTLH